MTKVSKKKQQPLISVVVPVYNVEKYIHKCIESIINQTYKNLEIILVDDGSPDDCPKICDEYAKNDKRIKVIHKENGGLSDARNVGIDVAKGEYITFIDSDDYVTIDYVSYLYYLLSKDKSIMSISNIKIVWNDDSIKNKFINEYLLKSEEVFENLLFQKGIEISAYGKLYSIDLWKNIRFPKGVVYEDSATIYKIIHNAKIISYGDKECYYYCARPGSISKQKAFNKNEYDYIKNTDLMLKFIKKNYINLLPAIERYFLYSRFRILRMLVVTKPRNYEMEQKIISEIKSVENRVLFYAQTPFRDKIAILMLKFNLSFFKISWILYCKFTGRIS